MYYLLIILLVLFKIPLNLYSFDNPKADHLLAREIAKPDKFIEQAFDVLHYEVTLDLTKAPSPETNGICKIVFKWIDNPDTNKFYFHLRDLTIDSVFYEKMKIEAFAVGNKTSSTYHYEVSPPYGKKGDTVSLTIYYQGRMTTEPTSPFWGGVSSRGTSLFAMGVGFYNNYVSATQHWMPCYDHPSDKATFRGLFKVKFGKYVASVGNLNSIFVLGDESGIFFEWKTDYPVATYLLTFAVDSYIHLSIPGSNTPIDIYTLRSDSAVSQRGYRLVPKMIDAFEQRFGKYPFEKVGYVNTPIGAMEHQTMISYPTNLIRTTDSINMVAAHELAHQWFGDLVTCKDFRDAWLNESFATYCESIWYEYLFGFDKYIENQKAKSERYIKSIARQEGVFPLFDFPRTPPSSNYPETIYQKGAVVLGMLRYELGDSLFFGSLRYYLDKFAYSTATTEDLENSIEEFSGHELDWFFNQWVYGKGWPVYDFKIKITKDDNDLYKFSVSEVKQVQNSSYGIYDNVPIEFSFWDPKEQVYINKVLKISKDIDNYSIDSLPEFQGFKINQGKNVVSLLELSSSISEVCHQVEPDINIKTYPNPAGTEIIFEYYCEQGFINLSIFNSLGEEIIKKEIIAEQGLNKLPLDIQEFPSGIYFVYIQQGINNLIIDRFVIVK